MPVRFFAVGEYGDRSERPHYHAALFNFPTCVRGRTLRLPGATRPEWDLCCPQCRLVGRAWQKGDIDLGNLEPHSAQYVAGYVTKKMTGVHDERLLGRYPEFARMSLRPGVGHGILPRIAAVLVEHNIPVSSIDVPSVLRHGTKMMPLGRYLRRKLRLLIGKDERCPDEVLQALQEEMQKLYALAPGVSEAIAPGGAASQFRKEVIKNAIIDANMGLKWSSEAKEKIANRRKL